MASRIIQENEMWKLRPMNCLVLLMQQTETILKH